MAELLYNYGVGQLGTESHAMKRRHCLYAALAMFGVLALGLPPVSAQQSNVGIGFLATSDGFREQIGTNWGLGGNGWFLSFGGLAKPPFGGFDPTAGASFGFGGPNGFLNVGALQGSNRTMVGGAPSVTVMNGGTGYFSDTVIRPFVTGFTPVVGSGGFGVVPPSLGPSVLEERLSRLQAGEAPGKPPGDFGQNDARQADSSAPAANPFADGSSAERGDLSVAEIKARKAAEQNALAAANRAEVEALLDKARAAEAAGKTGLAKLYLQMAERRTTGERQVEIQRRIDRLGASADE